MIVINLNNLINSDNMVTMYSLRYEPLTHSRVLKYNTDVTYIKKEYLIGFKKVGIFAYLARWSSNNSFLSKINNNRPHSSLWGIA